MKKTLRIILFLTNTVFFIWFMIPLCILGTLNVGNLAGMLLCVIIYTYVTLFEKCNSRLVSLWKHKTGKIVLCSAIFICILFLIFICVTLTQMIACHNNPSSEETTVIVLGCKVNADGPSLSMTERLEAAHKYLRDNPGLKCILSGGKGDDEHISEAQAMHTWLVEHGIPADRLYIEDKSVSTQENLLFSKDLIEKEGLCPRITIITNGFHQYRAKKIADSLALENYSVSGKTPTSLLPTYYLREIAAILFMQTGLTE